MLTQAALLAQLDTCGHPKTARGLTDWRAKGYLPRLVQRGVGRGRGASFVWTEPDVLARVLLVDDLLDGGVRGEEVVLCSWFAGFDANLASVRKARLARLASVSGRPLPKRFYAFEDMLGDLSTKLARSLATQFDFHPDDLDSLIFEALSVFYRPDYAFDPDDNIGLVETANDIAVRVGKVEPGSWIVTEAMLQQGFAFICERLSVPSRERLLKSVSDVELADAHRRWRLVLRYARELVVSYGSGTPSDFDALGRRLTIVAGPWAILTLLQLARSPEAAGLCEAERVLGDTEKRRPEDAFAALWRIWERRAKPRGS